WTYAASHQSSDPQCPQTITLRRSSKVAFLHCTPLPRFDEGRGCVVFSVSLPPHGSWRCSVAVSATIDGHEYTPAPAGGGFRKPAVYQDKCDRYFAESTGAELGTPDLAFTVRRALDQACRDLLALRLFDLDRPDGGWTVAAGLPVY